MSDDVDRRVAEILGLDGDDFLSTHIDCVGDIISALGKRGGQVSIMLDGEEWRVSLGPNDWEGETWVVGRHGPTLPAALCAAVIAAKEAGRLR